MGDLNNSTAFIFILFVVPNFKILQLNYVLMRAVKTNPFNTLLDYEILLRNSYNIGRQKVSRTHQLDTAADLGGARRR